MKLARAEFSVACGYRLPASIVPEPSLKREVAEFQTESAGRQIRSAIRMKGRCSC